MTGVAEAAEPAQPVSRVRVEPTSAASASAPGAPAHPVAHHAAQAAWAARPIAERLRVLRGARARMAADATRFTAAISPALPRSATDTLTAELMPLLDACRFLEKNAARVLRPRMLGRRGRPFWLAGVRAEIYREPLGEVLVIGPGNFPLFLPGVHALQALAAGNSVVWKPAPGGHGVALLFAEALYAAGLPQDVLHVTVDSVEAARAALHAQPAKVVFTGSYETGRTVLGELARSATPSVMELSGADAVAVFPGADLERVAKAVAFGLRLNGGQVCMSPRRLFAEPETMARLLPLLTRELAPIPAVPLSDGTWHQLRTLLREAWSAGATMLGELDQAAQKPLLLHARPEMQIAQSDVFAPVLALLELPAISTLREAYAACPYGLTVALFCSPEEEQAARTLGMSLRAGTVLLNDLIAPTADPRIPFSGRGASGFGATRGAEGLLEMTAPKVVLTRRGGSMRHLEPSSAADAPLLENLIRVSHAGTWRERWHAMFAVTRLGRQRSASGRNA